MFDLSMVDKPRSGISKLKDKIRGKKKDGFSDSASEIVSVAGTDSEGEGEDCRDSPKKKSNIKSLFGPKTNLHKNVSKSMLTLGTMPEKNSPLSISRSSGLNVESPDGKINVIQVHSDLYCIYYTYIHSTYVYIVLNDGVGS